MLSQPMAEVNRLAASAGLTTPDLGPLHAGVIRDATLERMMLLLAEQVQAGDAASSLAADGLRVSITGRLFSLADTPVPTAPKRAKLTGAALANVLELMHARLSEGVSLDELAVVAGVNPMHFGKLFKAATGEPPYAHLTRLRIEAAKRLLRDRPEWTIAAVAQDCGFFDQSHLSKHFKNLVGTTPAAWRDQA
ncbi:MAG: helix-turn-helix transcriptional regulator [Planctomycetota bacterium]